MTTESQTEPIEPNVDFEFTTKPKEQPAGTVQDEGLTISLDGYLMVARRPKNAIFAMLSSARTTSQRMGVLFDLLRAALSEADYAHLEERLNDGDDDFDIEDIADLAAKLAERWADDTKSAAKPKARGRRR